MNTYRKYFSEEYRFYYLGSIGVNVHIHVLYIRACDEFNYQLDFVAMCEIIFFSWQIEFIFMQLYNSKI